MHSGSRTRRRTPSAAAAAAVARRAPARPRPSQQRFPRLRPPAPPAPPSGRQACRRRRTCLPLSWPARARAPRRAVELSLTARARRPQRAQPRSWPEHAQLSRGLHQTLAQTPTATPRAPRTPTPLRRLQRVPRSARGRPRGTRRQRWWRGDLLRGDQRPRLRGPAQCRRNRQRRRRRRRRRGRHRGDTSSICRRAFAILWIPYPGCCRASVLLNSRVKQLFPPRLS